MELKIKIEHLLILLLLCTCPFIAQAQNKNVTGIVVEQGTEEPVIGASVMIKGTKQGTVTDLDGHFSISVPAGSPYFYAASILWSSPLSLFLLV